MLQQHWQPYMNLMDMSGLLGGSTDEGWGAQMAAQFYHVQQSIKIGHDHHNANNSWGKEEEEGDMTQLKRRLKEEFSTHLVYPES